MSYRITSPPIILVDDEWRKTQHCRVIEFGSCSIKGRILILVDRQGRDWYERNFSGEPMQFSEPLSLIRGDFKQYYAKLGHSAFLAILTANKGDTPKEIKAILKQTTRLMK